MAEDTALFYKIILCGQFSYTNRILASFNRIRDDGLNDDPWPEKKLWKGLVVIYVYSQSFFGGWCQKNVPALRHVLGRLGYFSGRCAELECAFGKVNECRYLALFGVLFSTSLKGKIKSLALLISSGLFRKKLPK